MNIRQFLDSSLTAYHAVENSIEFLESKGFSRLVAGEKWDIHKGGKYFVVKNGSAFIAFVVGTLDNYAFNIVEGHTDSPSLKVKGNKLLDSVEGKKLNVERYGGLILYSMMDIPLKIAGRVARSSDSGISIENVESDFYINIPSVCIHHNPEVNDKCALNVQVDMCPLLGEGEDVYGIFGEDILDADLYVVPAVKSSISGRNGEYLVSPRIDNLTSVYSGISALSECEPTGVAIACMFDNEEIGSTTKQGANSAFLNETLVAINESLGYENTDYIKAKNNGFVLSADNGHAAHPAHPEKSDPSERVILNGGIVIKHHPNYATDGVSSAVAKKIFDGVGVEYQDYYNRSDVRCGGTIGLMTGASLQMKVCDIGLAQLAMHSAIETVGVRDIDKMTAGMKAFFNATLKETDGAITIE